MYAYECKIMPFNIKELYLLKSLLILGLGQKEYWEHNLWEYCFRTGQWRGSRLVSELQESNAPVSLIMMMGKP